MMPEPWEIADRHFGKIDTEVERWPTCDVCGGAIPPGEEFYKFSPMPFAEDKVCQDCLQKYLSDHGYATYWED